MRVAILLEGREWEKNPFVSFAFQELAFKMNVTFQDTEKSCVFADFAELSGRIDGTILIFYSHPLSPSDDS